MLDHARRSAALRAVDGVVLVWVLQLAAGTVVSGDFGADAASLRWYGLAALYAGASWLACQETLPAWLRRLATFNLLLCAHACLQSAYAADAASRTGWPDWLVLGLCCVLGAALRWPGAAHDSCSSSSPKETP